MDFRIQKDDRVEGVWHVECRVILFWQWFQTAYSKEEAEQKLARAQAGEFDDSTEWQRSTAGFPEVVLFVGVVLPMIFLVIGLSMIAR